LRKRNGERGGKGEWRGGKEGASERTKKKIREHGRVKEEEEEEEDEDEQRSTASDTVLSSCYLRMRHTNTLQRTATHCNTL